MAYHPLKLYEYFLWMMTPLPLTFHISFVFYMTFIHTCLVDFLDDYMNPEVKNPKLRYKISWVKFTVNAIAAFVWWAFVQYGFYIL